MEEMHVEVRHLVTLVGELEPSAGFEGAEYRDFHVLALAQRLQFLPLRRRDRQHHPLLRFADPDFGVAEAVVLQRGLLELNRRAEVYAHLAHSRREAAGTAVGDRGEEVPVAGLQDDVLHLLFGDGVADLHRPAAHRLRLVRQFEAAEGRTVNAVAPRAPADRNDQVTGMHLLECLVLWNQPDGAAEHERVGEVALIEEDRAIDGRNAHAVAVVAHASHDAAHHASRMQHALRQLIRGEIRRREAEDVRVAHRLRGKPGAEHVADHPAKPGVRPAVGFNGRRVVVSLDLDADVEVLVEGHHTGVVREHAHTPVVRAELLADRLGCPEHRLFEEVLVSAGLLRAVIRKGDGALESLVRAVFRPRLSNRFEFDVGGVSLQFAEVSLHRLHLIEREGKRVILAELHKPGIVEIADGDIDELEGVRRAEGEVIGLDRANDDLLDGVVGEYLAKQHVAVERGDFRQPVVPAEGAHRSRRDAEHRQRVEDGLRDRVHHAGLK
jgi:hypothetical protein